MPWPFNEEFVEANYPHEEVSEKAVVVAAIAEEEAAEEEGEEEVEVEVMVGEPGSDGGGAGTAAAAAGAVATTRRADRSSPVITAVEIDMGSEVARVAALERENKRLRAALTASRQEVHRWSQFSADIFNSIVLSPDACAYYKELARTVLTQGLQQAALTVGYVDCSFPSTAGNAPTVEL